MTLVKFTSYVAVLLLLFVCLLPAGCGPEKVKEAGKSSIPTNKQVSQPMKKETVADLFAKGQRANSLSYEFVLTSSSGVQKGKVWIKDKSMKTEMTVQGQKVVSYFDQGANTIITYYPAQNQAVKLSADKQPGRKGFAPGEYTEMVDSQAAKIIGSEVYEGVPCKIVLYAGQNANEKEVRLWVREDYGLPMRVEVTSAAGEKTVMEFKNMYIGPLPSDTFELPAGVKVTDLNQMLNQLPSGTFKQP